MMMMLFSATSVYLANNWNLVYYILKIIAAAAALMSNE